MLDPANLSTRDPQIPNAGLPRLVQGGGAKYVNFIGVNQSLEAGAIAPPSAPFVLGSQLSLGGLPSMAPREGLLHLRSLRFACGLTSTTAAPGDAVDTPAPCTLDVVCEPVRKRAVTQSLTYYPSGAQAQRFASATFPQDDFSYLTGCFFNLTSTAVANVQDVALLLDDIQYQIERY